MPTTTEMMQSTKDVAMTNTSATNTPKDGASTGTAISPLTPFTSQIQRRP